MNVLVAIFSPFDVWIIPRAQVDRLRRTFPYHAFLHAEDPARAVELWPRADIGFASEMSPDDLAAARGLRWIHVPAAGVGGMLFPAMLESPVVMTNQRGMSADTIAEHVLAVTLAMFRKLPQAFESQRTRTWAQDAIGRAPTNRMIAGSRVLVIGAGGIGAAVARRMTALGARVTGVRRNAAAGAPDGIADIAPPERLHALLPDADVVVIAAPQTRETRGLIGRDELALMGAQTLLVNVSRGALVDERALADALAQGRPGGAALDVFEQEPLDPASPLWTLPNVLITPHTSGFRPDHWEAATDLFAENLRRFDSGQPLVNVVDKVAGY